MSVVLLVTRADPAVAPITPTTATTSDVDLTPTRTGATMFDHLSLGVTDLDRAATFYDAALSALGYVRLAQNARSVSYGPPGFTGEAPFAIIAHGPAARSPGPGFHLAFAAPSREAVDRFHAAALAAGGADEGPPGIRAHYDAGYYAAFVRDPDGHRLEAVVHEASAR